MSERRDTSDNIVKRAAEAMKKRAGEPLANLSSLNHVPVGSLGDAWPYLARAAIEAIREPTDAMAEAAHRSTGRWLNFHRHGSGLTQAMMKAKHRWRAMIDEALRT